MPGHEARALCKLKSPSFVILRKGLPQSPEDLNKAVSAGEQDPSLTLRMTGVGSAEHGFRALCKLKPPRFVMLKQGPRGA